MRPLLQLSLAIIGASLAYVAYLGALQSGDQIAPPYDSDSMYLPELAEDILAGGQVRSGWITPPANYLFPDGALYFALYALLREATIAHHIYGWLQYLAFAALLVTGLRLAAGDRGAKLGMNGVLIALVWFPIAAGSWLSAAPLGLLFHASFHSTTLVNALALGLLFARQLIRPRLWRDVLIFALLALNLASDRIILGYCLAPAIAASAVALLTSRRIETVSRIVRTLSPGLLAIPAGNWLLRNLNRIVDFYNDPHIVQHLWTSLSSMGTRGDAALASLARHAEQLPALYILLGAISLVFLAIWSGSVFRRILSRDAVQQSLNEAQLHARWLAAYLILIPTGMALVGLILGFSTDYVEARHLLPVFVGAFFGGAIGLDLGVRRHQSKPLQLVFSCALLGSAAVIGWRAIMEPPVLAAYKPPEAQCLRALADELKLTDGYGHYWYAKRMSVLTLGKVRVNQLTDDLRIHYWINNSNWYFEGENQDRNGFVIANLLEAGLVREVFGRPTRTVQCGEMSVLVFSDDRARGRFQDFKLGLLGQVRTWEAIVGRRSTPVGGYGSERPTHAITAPLPR